jgi:hypothetical protein
MALNQLIMTLHKRLPGLCPGKLARFSYRRPVFFPGQLRSIALQSHHTRTLPCGNVECYLPNAMYGNVGSGRRLLRRYAVQDLHYGWTVPGFPPERCN